ncbi:Rid family hydrolase [Limnohabitans sp.]|uniref:Rid family hydrolase n=1 Tax=Limnohabitans sp. TaxID=1907725 RepID=UPI0039BCD927|nr:RidA family protein [Comamonadaceae bacterium]
MSQDIQRLHVAARYSEAAIFNGVVYLKTRILRTQIYLKDIADIAAMNEVWDAWVVAGSAPPRATVQAALANPAYLIEVVVTAAVKA